MNRDFVRWIVGIIWLVLRWCILEKGINLIDLERSCGRTTFFKPRK